MAVRIEKAPVSLEEAGFREIYHRFVYLERCGALERAAGGQLEPADTGVIAHGYWDALYGSSFCLLAAARLEGDEVKAGRPLETACDGVLRCELAGTRFSPLTDGAQELDRFLDRISMVRGRRETKDANIRRLRDMRELDESRLPGSPDTVRVFLVGPGRMPEAVYARPDLLMCGEIWGAVTSIPRETREVRTGDRIRIRPFRKKDGSCCLISVVTD